MPKTHKKEMEGASSQGRDFKALFYRKLTETHLFFEIGRTIASEVEPYELIHKVLASIKKAVQFADAVVYIAKKDMTGLVPLYFQGPHFEGAALENIYLDNGAPGMIASNGEPLFMDDCDLFDGFIHFPDEGKKPGSYIGVALKNDNRIIGVIGLSHGSHGAFKVEDFDLLRTVSHVISAGYEKAELFSNTLELSRVDELTGLYNYRVLMEKLEEEVRRKVRTGRSFSFIMIDIDDFKKVNDRFGHLEGSRLLAQLGPLLKYITRAGSTDTCFRYGGEEFSILLAETGFDEAMMVAERVRKGVEEYPFSLKVAHPHEIATISLGVSTMDAGSGKSAAAIINEADIALYRSKALGKNRVTGYTEGMENETIATAAVRDKRD